MPRTHTLANVHVAVALFYLTLLSHVVAAAGLVLAKPAWRTWTKRVTGAVLIFFGLHTAATA